MRKLNLFLCGVETLFVALFGPVTASLLLLLFQADASDLTDSRNLFRFLMLDAFLSLILVQVLLKTNRESWQQLWWKRAGLGSGIVFGTLAVPFLFLTVHLVTTLLLIWQPDWGASGNPVLEMIGTPYDLALFLFTSVAVGGFKEEIQRAYVAHRFQHDAGSYLPGIVIWSVIFGSMHLSQGPSQAIAAGMLGLVFGSLLIWRKNLWAPITAHAVYDVVVVLLAWNANAAG